MDFNIGWVLIAVAALLIGFTVYGLKKGLVHIVVGVLGIAVALAGAVVLTTPVSTFIEENTGLHDKIKQEMVDFVKEQIDKAKQEAIKSAKVSSEAELKMEDLKKELNKITLPTEVKNAITETSSSVSAIGAKTAENAAEKMTVFVIKGIAFVICFIVLMIAVTVLKIALKITAKLPLINKVNGMAGGIAGLIEGVIVVWIFFAIATAMASQAWAQDALSQIGNNTLLLLLYKINPIIGLL